MRTGDVTRAQYQRFATKLLKIRRFGAKRYCLRTMPGEALSHAHQLGIGILLEGRHSGGNGREIDLHLMTLGQGLQLAADNGPQRIRVHARQRAQVKFKRALAANPVGVVAAMDTAKVKGRLRHAELRIAVLIEPLLTQPLKFADRVVHGLQRAVAQAWVG